MKNATIDRSKSALRLAVPAEDTVVSAMTCPLCGYTIYSRARHDYRPCKCKAIAVDGGSEYFKASWDPSKCAVPEPFELTVQASRRDLYDDWSKRTDKFGLIAPKKDEHAITTAPIRANRPGTRRAPAKDRKPAARVRKNPRS